LAARACGDKVDIIFCKSLKGKNLFEREEKIIEPEKLAMMDLSKYDAIITSSIGLVPMFKDGWTVRILEKLTSHPCFIEIEHNSFPKITQKNMMGQPGSFLTYNNSTICMHHNHVVDDVNEDIFDGKLRTMPYWFGITAEEPPKNLKPREDRSLIVAAGYPRAFRTPKKFISWAKFLRERCSFAKKYDFVMHSHVGGFSCMRYEKHPLLIQAITKIKPPRKNTEDSFIYWKRFIPRDEVLEVYNNTAYYWSHYDYSKHSPLSVKLEYGQLDSMFQGAIPILNREAIGKYIHPFSDTNVEYYATMWNFRKKNHSPIDVSRWVVENYNFIRMWEKFYRPNFKEMKKEQKVDWDGDLAISLMDFQKERR